MPNTYVKDDSGVLRLVRRISVKDAGGVLRDVRAVHEKDSSGALLFVFNRGLTGVVNVDSQDLQLDSLAILAGWNGSDPIDFLCVIPAGIYVRASSTGAAAINTGPAWPVGSFITIQNNGFIQGYGGAGGNGGTAPSAPSGGAAGGPAMILQYNVTIDNTSGFILAGGGGGGGGDWAHRSCGIGKSFHECYANGGGGGGGAGSGAAGSSFTNPGGPGSNTVVDLAGGGGGGGGDLGCCGGGFAGNAGAGGGWGLFGANGALGFGGGSGVITAGAPPGPAIATLGRTITWAGGFNGSQVRGAIT